MLEVQNEYQLFVPTPRQLGRISEQSKFEEILPRIRENVSQKQKLSKFEFRQMNSSRQIIFKNEKNPYQDKSLEKSQYQKTSQSQLSKSRSITDHQSPQKQQTVRSYKTNTETDQIIIHTDEEKGKTKYKRDEKKRKTSNFRAGQMDDPKIKQLDEQIQRLSDQLKNLKDYLNNSRKLFLVVRNLVGTRKNLRKVLIKNGKEELVDFSDLAKFYKFFYIKEIVNINGEQRLIDRLNFNLLDDLYYANEVLENLLVQNQILEIKRIADQKRMKQIDQKQYQKQIKLMMSNYQFHQLQCLDIIYMNKLICQSNDQDHYHQYKNNQSKLLKLLQRLQNFLMILESLIFFIIFNYKISKQSKNMIFEEALGVDDDYIRLQKISEGIKQIAQTLKTSKTFQSSVLLKQMFCSYPFAEEQIEQLLDECYEQYKNDGKFIMAIHRAIQDLASLQEYRQFLGTRSIFSRQNSKLLNNNNVTATLKEQLKQGSIPFSREVIERLIIAKQFSIKYIKPIFQLSFEYKFDLEQLAQIFKVFLQHTKNEEFQQKIIDIYEELKLTVFKDLDWIEQFNQDLEDYFVQNKLKVPPKLIQSKLIHIKTKNKKILQQHYKKNSVKMETESDSLSNSNSPGQPLIIDYKKRIQQWLCNKEIQQLDLDSYVFITNSENFNILISFIVNPAKLDLIENWQQEFENEVECHNKKYFKNINIQLDKYQIIRSYKASMMFGDINNLKQIDKILTTFIENTFRRIYEAIINDEINFNLNHIAYLIEQLILFNSQKSIHQILEYNLLFTLSLYIYNHKITTLIGEIISLWIDKFKLGYYVQEQIWKYLDYTNWFNFFFSIMIKQQKRNDQCYKEYKSLKIDGILAFVKLLKSPEKTLQTQPDQLNSITSRQDPVTPIEFSEEQQILNSSQWFLDNNYTANQIMDDGSTKDFDNLKKFNTEKNKSLASEQDSPLRIRLFQSSYSKGFYAHSTQKSSQSIVSPKNKMSNSSISLPSIDIKLQKSESVDSQSCLNYLTRQRNKTTFVSQDGFSTTKLISIYPRRNIDLQFTNFEITKQSFIYNRYSIKGSIQINKMIFQSIFNTLNYQENIVKDSYQRQQFINLALRQFITEKTIITIFRVFLYGLFDETNKLLGKLSSECGQIILELFQNGLTLKDKNLNQILKTCFDQTVDYLVKKIIELNNFPHLPEFKFIQNQLSSILVVGLQFYEIYNSDKDDRNIFRNLNETVMHIFIIWFFNSNQNNQFQLNFVKLIAILFSKAPQYQLQNLLFHVGFLTSLFNGFCSYNKNGCKNIEYVESLYMNLTYLIYIIHQNVYFRQLDQLIQNLESSSSWKGLQQGLPTNENKFLKYLIKLMNIENKDQKKNKINMKFNSQPNSKGTNRNVNEEKMEISQLNEILKQKQVSNDQSTSPMKQQVQIKKLIRYRTKNSIKA